MEPGCGLCLSVALANVPSPDPLLGTSRSHLSPLHHSPSCPAPMAPCMWNSKCISGLGHADVLWPCPGKLLQFLVGQQGAVGTVQCGAGMGWPASAWTLIRGKSPPFPWLGSSSSFWAGEAMKFLLNPKYTPIKKLLSDPKWDIPLLMTKQLFPSSWLW